MDGWIILMAPHGFFFFFVVLYLVCSRGQKDEIK